MKSRECFVDIDGEKVSGYLHGLFQKSEPYTALINGEQSGQLSYPVAVVEINRVIKVVAVDKISFPFDNPDKAFQDYNFNVLDEEIKKAELENEKGD